jgi:phosphoribosylanthranilate isomerase
MIIKVCGLRDDTNIKEVVGLGIDWIGMVFCESSPRNVTMIPTHAGIIPDRSSIVSAECRIHDCKRVGVFVDEMPQNIITRVVNFQLDLIQFDGHETPTLLRNLRLTFLPDICPHIQMIKTIALENVLSLASCKDYEDCTDYFLFVPATADMTYDSFLQIVSSYQGSNPFLIGGFSDVNDVEGISRLRHPLFMGVDLADAFDTTPGMKNTELLKSFIKRLRKI